MLIKAESYGVLISSRYSQRSLHNNQIATLVSFGGENTPAYVPCMFDLNTLYVV